MQFREIVHDQGMDMLASKTQSNFAGGERRYDATAHEEIENCNISIAIPLLMRGIACHAENCNIFVTVIFIDFISSAGF